MSPIGVEVGPSCRPLTSSYRGLLGCPQAGGCQGRLKSKNEEVLRRRIGKSQNDIGRDVVRRMVSTAKTNLRMAADTSLLAGAPYPTRSADGTYDLHPVTDREVLNSLSKLSPPPPPPPSKSSGCPLLTNRVLREVAPSISQSLTYIFNLRPSRKTNHCRCSPQAERRCQRTNKLPSGVTFTSSRKGPGCNPKQKALLISSEEQAPDRPPVWLSPRTVNHTTACLCSRQVASNTRQRERNCRGIS